MSVLSWARACYFRSRQRAYDVLPWETLAARHLWAEASVALVGNAGYLAELRQGRFVDSHDVIIRMNNFRLAGFEEAVGHRTDVLLTNFHKDIDFSNPALHQASVIVSSSPNNFQRTPERGLFIRHGERITTGMLKLGASVVFAPDTERFLGWIEQIGRYPTTGAVGVFLLLDYLLPVIKTAYVTGFSFFAGRSHYFNDATIVPNNHNVDRERTILSARLEREILAGRVSVDPIMNAHLHPGQAA